MIKKQLMLCSFLVLGAIGAKAQNAVPAAGGDATGSGGSVAYSVGQTAYTSVSSSNGSVSQGVQQPYTIEVTGVKNDPGINLQVSVYPNPSTSFINLKIENRDLQNLSYQLVDVTGKLLADKKITNAETSIMMEGYAAGNYFLKVTDHKSELKTFKIIKN